MLTISLLRPELETFIKAQVGAGRFDSVEELVEAALHRFMAEERDDEDFDEATISAILRADAQCERGEARDLADVAADLRKRASEL